MARQGTTDPLDQFALDWRTAAGQPSLRDARGWLAIYRRPCHWNDRMARLLADPVPWHQRPVPAPDWSPKGMATWNRAHMSDYPPAQGPDVNAFRKALAAAACAQGDPPRSSARDAAPTSHVGTWVQCLSGSLVGAGPRYAPIPHTCGQAGAVAHPTPRRRRRAA